ncbi:MAG: tRNA pseudouridine(38-40) synthase TruA [Clostridia bacterium]|nr:tRNA pseudouridine(38-40) synthase TruA [Clostridia bacterium]
MKTLLTISFDGSGFSGFQYQPGVPTVQGSLTTAARRLFGDGCLVTGCSRTDAGVHAIGFCATLELPGGERPKIDIRKIPDAMNFHLPESVSVLSAREVPDSFHPRYSVVDKTYSYLISLSPKRMPLTVGRVYTPSAPIDGHALETMDAAARLLEGKRDFASYMASGSKITDTVRTIRSASVRAEHGVAVITLTADGFLYNMVRIISGTLLDIAHRGADPGVISRITEARDRKAAGPTLPPYGLYLVSVNYEAGDGVL